MAKSNNPRPVRSLLRRLVAPFGMTAALLGGGGWGVYHFTTQPSEDSVVAPSETPHSAAAKEELKNLFALEDKNSEDTTEVLPSRSTVSERYAQSETLEDDSLRSEPKQLTPQKTVSPFGGTVIITPDDPSELQPERTAAVPTKGSNDRYANYTAAPIESINEAQTSTLSTPEEEIEENVDSIASLDVTRGQEPSYNPLRAAPTPTNTTSRNDPEAMAAFGSATASDSPPTSNPLSNAFNNAQPLPATPQPRNTDSRYALGSPQAANLPSRNRFDSPSEPVTQTRQPTPDFAPETPPAPVAVETTIPTPDYHSRNVPPAAPTNNYVDRSSITPTPGLANSPGTGRPGERLLEGLQSPSITIQKLSPPEIQVGKRCTFAIRVQNTGQRTAQNVEIHDEIPLGTELVGTAPRASISGSNVIWELGTLSAGEERTVEMELIPTEEGELGSVATVLLAAQASAKSRCTRPELALRLSASKPQVLMGDQQIVQIEVTNPGSGDATNVMLLENVPHGVSHEAGPALEFEVGTLRAGESKRLELVLSAEKAGRVNNLMTARADAGLQVDASCDFEVIAPELQLSIEGPQKRYLERPATYKVSINNPGTATAHDIQLVTHLPKGLQFVSANNMGEYDSSTHTIHWSLMELPANERGTVELVALPIEPGEQTMQIATKARQGLEDRTEKQVMVEGLAALMFEVGDLEDPIEIGRETTYEVRVVNQGSKAASNVQVVAILPPGLRALSGQGETRHTIQGERVVFAPIPSLGPKADSTYRIQVQGTRPGDQRLRVQITTDDIQQPITKEESTRVYADE